MSCVDAHIIKPVKRELDGCVLTYLIVLRIEIYKLNGEFAERSNVVGVRLAEGGVGALLAAICEIYPVPVYIEVCDEASVFVRNKNLCSAALKRCHRRLKLGSPVVKLPLPTGTA